MPMKTGQRAEVDRGVPIDWVAANGDTTSVKRRTACANSARSEPALDDHHDPE